MGVSNTPSTIPRNQAHPDTRVFHETLWFISEMERPVEAAYRQRAMGRQEKKFSYQRGQIEGYLIPQPEGRD